MAVVRVFGKEYSYVLKEERMLPKREQTVWWYGVADLETQYAMSEVIEFEGDPSQSEGLRTIYRPDRRAEAEVIRSCLHRVENLKDEEGNPVEWLKDNKKQQDEFLAVLPPAWRSELAAVFRAASRLAEDELKNCA
jgi:hypothetical protein